MRLGEGEGGAARGLQARAAEAWGGIAGVLACWRLYCARGPRSPGAGRNRKKCHRARPKPCLFNVYNTDPWFSPLFGLSGFSEPAPRQRLTQGSVRLATATTIRFLPPSFTTTCVFLCFMLDNARCLSSSAVGARKQQRPNPPATTHGISSGTVRSVLLTLVHLATRRGTVSFNPRNRYTQYLQLCELCAQRSGRLAGDRPSTF